MVHSRPGDITSDIFYDAILNLDDAQMMEFVRDYVDAERSAGNPDTVAPKDVYLRKQLSTANGVACFSEMPKHLLMWSHYADSHRGFCLEFSTDFTPFRDQLYRVSYETKMPAVVPSERDFGDLFELRKFLLIKAREWRYEKEWRAVSNLSDTTLDYPAEALKRILVGAKATTRTANALKKSVLGRPVAIVRLKLSDNRFRLEEVPA